ncbi:HNH endonuclease [Mucilaginibacter pallidiroseus]|uniref:HNH endonuclease n=1 Tax=Mucilaginibacter pallidiroseus TaxID=2599295 RepID=A0A563TZJ3_9SPHI|nr:HNH endonuclease [Mucilaginibacter pallidiroseus]TWR24798.1 HNH endonuclease [Mucilaginibacter pallidiroseus]
MKNLRSYDEDSFAFYELVRSRKRDAALVARLTAMDANMRLLFDRYDQSFAANDLQSLNAHGYVNQDKADLGELYEYDSATLSKLKDRLTTTPSGRLVKCQYCTINSISTFDHFVPQGDFPEFIVHPKNLLCCCGDCNPRKGSRWRNAGQRTVLNLYLDTLPAVQYLFVTVDIGFTSMATAFYLENRNGVDARLFALLVDHYSKLNLYERFSDEADTVITTFRSVIEPYRENHTLQETRQFVLETIRKEQIAFGQNYWQSVLKLELINNDDFLIDYE